MGILFVSRVKVYSIFYTLGVQYYFNMKTTSAFIALFLTLNFFSQTTPSCERMKKDIQKSISTYMTKHLGFTSANGIKIECPVGGVQRSFQYEELVGPAGPKDEFLAYGVVKTPEAEGGGYYELYFKIWYSRWTDFNSKSLSSKWHFTASTIYKYIPYNVPGEDLSADDKINFFKEFISSTENLDRFGIGDFVEIEDIQPLGKISNVDPYLKVIYFQITGKMVSGVSRGKKSFEMRPNASITLSIDLVKEEGKWNAARGSSRGKDYGDKYKILEPITFGCLKSDGWGSVYQKLLIKDGELKIMSKNTADLLKNRMESLSKLCPSLQEMDEATGIATLLPFMSPNNNPNELAKSWYHAFIDGLPCTKTTKFRFSGEVTRSDYKGIKGYYNFKYDRPAAKDEATKTKYAGCNIPEDKMEKYFRSSEKGEVGVELFEGVWYLTGSPKLVYNYDGTKR